MKKKKEKREVFVLYVHTCILNNKKYVGITIQEPNKRWRNGRGYEGQFFHKGIVEFGWENFTHEILFDNLTQEEANRLEVEYIKKYKSQDEEYGWNKDNGGNHEGCRSEETKAKISKTMKDKKINIGSKNPMYGKISATARKIICLETKEIFDSIMQAADKMNLDLRLISAVCKGKRHTTGYYHFMYLEYYDENATYNLKYGVEHNTKSIICVETGEVFKSIIECSKKMNIPETSISGVLRGKSKTTKGYHFKYYTE